MRSSIILEVAAVAAVVLCRAVWSWSAKVRTTLEWRSTCCSLATHSSRASGRAVGHILVRLS